MVDDHREQEAAAELRRLRPEPSPAFVHELGARLERSGAPAPRRAPLHVRLGLGAALAGGLAACAVALSAGGPIPGIGEDAPSQARECSDRQTTPVRPAPRIDREHDGDYVIRGAPARPAPTTPGCDR